MAKYFKVGGSKEDILGVVAEKTNKGRYIPLVELKNILEDYYRGFEENVTISFISEEASQFEGGFFGGWTDDSIVDEYCRGFSDERICLEESGLNYPGESEFKYDRWHSGRQISVK